MSPNEKAPPGAEGRLFTIPAGEPFLAALARAILDGVFHGAKSAPLSPLALSGVTVLLPDANAARVLGDAFLDASPDGAALLPRMRAIGEAEEELTLLAALAGAAPAGADGLDIPEAASEIERRLTLTRLVMEWSRRTKERRGADTSLAALQEGVVADTPAKALRLAADLARLMDIFEREGVSMSSLGEVAPKGFEEHWRRTREVLDIAGNAWPAHLAARGLVSAIERRERQMRMEARRIAALAPRAPIIAAGITRLTPAALELTRAALAAPNGALVLPGLDLSIGDDAWNAVRDHPEHPQFAIRKLLDNLGLDRASARPLTHGPTCLRARFAGEAMRPAATTGAWSAFANEASRAGVREALADVSLIEAPSAPDEAEAVALILREAAGTPGRTAALVTPDRALARRVSARLASWDITVAASGRTPLAGTQKGAFLDLVAGAFAAEFAPAALVALLKHPRCRLGLDPAAFRRAARALEIAAFRAPYIGGGLDAVSAALERAGDDVASGRRRHMAVRRLRPDAWSGARELVVRLRRAFESLNVLAAGQQLRALAAFAAAHFAAADALAREAAAPEAPGGDEGGGAVREPWRGAGGEDAKALLEALAADASGLTLHAQDYHDFYRALVRDETVRAGASGHPRLFIWTPAEARLRRAGVMVLGGLNDGTWPSPPDSGPWLGRPMRRALGLPVPEERIGEAAHDFASCLAAPRVYLTRAEKVDGAPASPSRWLMRIKALLAALDMKALAPERPWTAWARARSEPASVSRLRPPEPRPPLAARPRSMSVSRVETWMANPYAVFAERVLRLEPLDALGLPPEVRERGVAVHAALSRFAEEFPAELPADCERELIAFAREAMAGYLEDARVAAFWRPRFEQFARWFADTESARREGVEKTVAELPGRLELEASGGAFTLTARADRIDMSADGLVLTDYKTGSNLQNLATRAAKGLAPQLPLEAAIAAAGGFEGVEARAVHSLRYISASGGDPPGEERGVKCADVAALASATLAGLARLVARFDEEATPYRATRRAGFTYRFDAYAHLARVAEWSRHDDEGE